MVIERFENLFLLPDRKPVNLVCVVHDEMVLPGDVQVVNKMITIITNMTMIIIMMFLLGGILRLSTRWTGLF